MRLRTSLLFLSLATAIPLLAFALLATALVVQREYDARVEAAKTRNRATLGAVDAHLQGTIATLRALTAGRALTEGDLPTFHESAQRVLATQPDWINVLVHDVDGRQLVNANFPYGTALPTTSVAPDSLSRAARSMQPVIDDLTRTPRSGVLGVPVRVPVVRDGRTVYVLTAMLQPASFERLLTRQGLPGDWVSGLVDGRGQVIARVPPVPAGTLASEGFRAHTARADEGWYRGGTIEGHDTFTAFLRSPLTGWTIGYAMPAGAVLAGATRAALLMVVGVLLSMLAAAALGLWLIRRIARPVSELAAAASSLAGGGVPVPVASEIEELQVLSRSLADAAAKLRERDGEIERSSTALRLHAATLQQANAARSQFLALLAHELRNPLAPLRNGIALLRLQRDAGKQAETQAMMERQVGHMARLIEDLLDVNRIDRGQLELRRQHVGIEAVVATAVEVAKPAIEAKQQALVVRHAREALFVDGDPVRLGQVVSNLLNNASKFTPAGGRIDLAIDRDADLVCLSVQDEGIGFPAEDAARIFELFVQLDASRTHSTGGLGIGLTLVRSIVELHGGRIEAHSDGPGRGARFVVRLPAAAATAVPAGAPAAAAPPSVHQRRVLVVDDNADARRTLAELVQLHGHAVRAAADGAEALQLARELQPQVAFLDLDMPGMSGLELAHALRQALGAAAPRLIAVTGLGRASDVADTRLAGFEAHLTKPVDPDLVIRLLDGAGAQVIALRAAGGGAH